MTLATAEAKDPPDILPITREAYERYFETWLLWIGTERKFLPSIGGLEDQPTQMLETFFTLDTVYDKMVADEVKRRTKT